MFTFASSTDYKGFKGERQGYGSNTKQGGRNGSSV